MQLPMRPFFRLGFLPLVVIAILLAVTGFAAAQTPTPTAKATRVGPHDMLPELQGIPKDQLFDHFRGSQFTITDAQGNAVVYLMTAGTVSGLTGTTVTVTPTGQTTPMSFDITPTTRVRATPDSGSLQAVVQGDKVMVLSRQGSSDAVFIAKHDSMGMYHHFGGPM